MIKKGKLGKFSKIKEEYKELKHAIKYEDSLAIRNEAYDLLRAVKRYIKKLEKDPVQIDIIINGKNTYVYKNKVSYNDIVKLAGLEDSGIVTVTYCGAKNGKEGILKSGQKVSIIKYTIFCATITNQA